MARRKRGGLPFRLSGKAVQRYGGGEHPDERGKKQAGLKVGRHHGSSRKQRKIASGRM
jgi:hypothetical protein